jgi:hypothetical protein
MRGRLLKQDEVGPLFIPAYNSTPPRRVEPCFEFKQDCERCGASVAVDDVDYCDGENLCRDCHLASDCRACFVDPETELELKSSIK